MGLLQGVLTARALGPEGLGEYSALLVDVNLLTTLLALGLPGGLAVLSGETDRGSLFTLWAHGIRHVFAALLLGSLIGLSLAVLAPSLLDELLLSRSFPLLLLFCCVGQLGRDMHNALLWGRQRFSTQNRAGLLLSVLQLLVVSTLYVLGKLDVLYALTVQTAAVWGLCIVFLVRLEIPFHRTKQTRSGTTPSEESNTSSTPPIRRLYAVSLRNFFHILMDLLLYRIDVYLIALYVPAQTMRHDLGIYQAGVRIGELLLLIPGTLNAVLFAKAAAKESVVEQTLVCSKLSLYFGIAATVAMLVVGKPLLILAYGERFSASFAPCLLILCGTCVLCFSGPLAGSLSGAAGYPKSVIVAQGLALGTNVGVNLVLLPRIGILGAAWASLLAYAVSSVCITAAFARHFSIPLSTLFRPVSVLSLVKQHRKERAQ